MTGLLSRLNGEIYSMMRIVAGFLLLWHGSSKLFGFPKESGAPAYVLYIAGPIELLGGVLLMLGLFTRPVAFLCSGLMASAYWMAHGRNGLLPLLNGGELAAIYCFVFLFIASQGGGKWSLDVFRGRRG